jgi:hypothetical protein
MLNNGLLIDYLNSTKVLPSSIFSSPTNKSCELQQSLITAGQFVKDNCINSEFHPSNDVVKSQDEHKVLLQDYLAPDGLHAFSHLP